MSIARQKIVNMHKNRLANFTQKVTFACMFVDICLLRNESGHDIILCGYGRTIPIFRKTHMHLHKRRSR